ncbi:basic proline-rich protein-like [Orussus abietinus]|uniref:basic proline-rich protein-like n=1 Tax=Orussus abietinus TaxID=222816 RepID=UPI000C7160D4|nr:basic proline-rich protein-like [Orussus abietinus]
MPVKHYFFGHREVPATSPDRRRDPGGSPGDFGPSIKHNVPAVPRADTATPGHKQTLMCPVLLPSARPPQRLQNRQRPQPPPPIPMPGQRGPLGQQAPQDAHPHGAAAHPPPGQAYLLVPRRRPRQPPRPPPPSPEQPQEAMDVDP